MRNFLKSSIIVIVMASPSTFAHHDKVNPGLFYEYDTEGTRCDQAFRKIGSCTKAVIKAPFQAVEFCYDTTKSTLSRIAHEIELFLSDSRSVAGKRVELRKALADWQADPLVEEYYMEQDRNAGTNVLLGVPRGAWELLKNTLYTAGFRIPRATMRTLKSMISGTCDCATI